MVHSVHREMTLRLLAQIESGTFPATEEVRIPAAHYTDAERLALEMRELFQKHPIIVAHVSELAEPGSCITVDDLGVGAVVVRDKEGVLRAFLNACRHRSTRLVNEPSCTLKSFVCPYHKWSYDLSGKLKGMPHPDAFASIERAQHGLVALPVVERHGFVWLCADRDTSLDISSYLGPIGEELDALGIADHVVHKSFSCERAANWKLVIDAFLEAYHIRTLHHDTLARFFLDARALVEQEGKHLRAVTARKRIGEARQEPIEQWRELVTPSYVLFPNTVIIAHPSYVSMVTVFPLATDRLRWVHKMLLAERPGTDAEHAHWDRTMQLIEREVFQGEDLHVAELMQRGLQTGANEEMLFGQLESAVPLFHGIIEAALR